MRGVDFRGVATATAPVAPPVPVGAAGVTLRAPRPNPARGVLRLGLAVDAAQVVRVELFDVTGRRVAVLFDGPAAPGAETPVVLDAAGLPGGVYVVRATGARGTAAQRVTLVR